MIISNLSSSYRALLCIVLSIFMFSVVSASNKPLVSLSSAKLVFNSVQGDVPLTVDEAADIRVKIDPTEEGFYDVPGKKATKVPLSGLPAGSYTLDALASIQQDLVSGLTKLGYYGIAVTPDPKQINLVSGDDMRGGSGELTFLVFITTVDDVRTVAKGSRIKNDFVNNKRHVFILNHSPVKDSEEASGSINRRKLDNYLERLNMHPSRRVDASIAASKEPGKAVVDYIVNEGKAFQVYAQFSNTGTESTDEWRERIGLIHNQVTGVDDVFSMDFSTAVFDEANSLTASYTRPIVRPEWLMVQVYGYWSDFEALNLSVPSQGSFTGESYNFGFALSTTPWVMGPFNATIAGGYEYTYHEVEGLLGTGNVGETDVYTTYGDLGINFKKRAIHQGASFRFASHSLAEDLNQNPNLAFFGAQNPDINTNILYYNFQNTAYPVALLSRSPEAKMRTRKYALETMLNLRGQYNLGNTQTIPQLEGIVGGFYTVRGYPESFASGDDTLSATAEAQLHIPRLFKSFEEIQELASDGLGERRIRNQNWNFRPTNPYAEADWDLIARAFLDYGHTNVKLVSAGSPRTDRDLMSFGTGFELQHANRLNIRCDVGYILRAQTRQDLATQQPIPIDEAQDGDIRVHFAATLSF